MGTDERYTKSREEKFLQVLAKELNLTYDELCELEPFIEDNTGYDDQIHCKIIRFQGDCEKYRNRIHGLENNQIFLSLDDWYSLQKSVGKKYNLLKLFCYEKYI